MILSCKRFFNFGESVARQTLFKETVGNDLRYKHIYLCHVDKYIGAYNPHTGEVVGYDTGDKFVPFVQKILDTYPEYSLHNVINEGIQEVIRKEIQSKRLSMEILGKSR